MIDSDHILMEKNVEVDESKFGHKISTKGVVMCISIHGE